MVELLHLPDESTSKGWGLGLWCWLPGFKFSSSNSWLLCTLGTVLNLCSASSLIQGLNDSIAL